jgi:hypothetical protein
MTIAGVIVTFVGFLISVASLGLTSDVNGRLIIVLVGIVVSLAGIIGMINRAAVSKAIWRK